MSEHKFDEILDYLCSGIISKKERQSVRDELYDHLMTEFEINLACGMSENQAAEAAENALGDRYSIKRGLSSVHRYNPIKDLQNIFYLIPLFCIVIAYGLVFSDYSVISVIAAALSFCFSYIFRNANKAFRLLFFSVTALSAEFLAYVSFGLIFEKNSVFAYLLPAVTFITSLVSLAVMHYTLCKLISTDSLNTEKWVPLIGFLINTVALTVVYSNFFIKFQSKLIWLVMLIPLLINLLIQISVNEALEQAEISIKSEQSHSKRALAAALPAIIFIAMLALGNYLYFAQPAKATDISANELITESADRAKIENILISYGMPKEISAILPDSEIQNYKSLAPKPSNPLIPDGFECCIHSDTALYSIYDLILPLESSENEITFRVLKYIKYKNSYEDYGILSNGKAGYFIDYKWNFGISKGFTPLPETETFLIADFDGVETVYSQAIKHYKGDFGEGSGFEFKINDNTAIIYGLTVKSKSGDIEPEIYQKIVFLKRPYKPNITLEELAEKTLGSDNDYFFSQSIGINHYQSES
ncbi:MAG: hypothetical protein ACI4JG_10640 [Acutalibacteraceae bacterium]